MRNTEYIMTSEKEARTGNTGLAKVAVQWLNRAHLGSARCALSESSGVERHKSFVLRTKFSAG
jgi:hypothetical protein